MPERVQQHLGPQTFPGQSGDEDWVCDASPLDLGLLRQDYDRFCYALIYALLMSDLKNLGSDEVNLVMAQVIWKMPGQQPQPFVRVLVNVS